MKRGTYVRTKKIRQKTSNAIKEYLETHKHQRGMLGKKHSEKTKKLIGKKSKGRKVSPETIQKMKDNHIGMTGKFHSEKTKKEMSIARKGRKRKPFSEEWKRNIGLAKKGQKHSEETKKKMSIANKGRQWSKEHLENFIVSRTGPKHPNWKGGKYKSHGYVYVTKKKHPFSDKKGKIFEHRIVMEKSLGRFLSPEEVVHHINCIKDDNKTENLKLFPNNKIHMQYHYDNRIIVLIPPE